MKASVLIAIAMTVSPLALAGGKKPSPPPDPTRPTSEQAQQQHQAQEQSQQQAAVASARAASSAVAGASSSATGGAGGTGIGGAGGNSGGNTLATAYESRDRALALALPGQTAAPAVAGECLEHDRGGSGLSIGVTGRTRINRDCMEFVQCVAIADRYAAWGQLQLAVEQLEQCGGVEDAVLEAPAEVDEATSQAFVTREEFERAYVELLAK